jgi:hypothetical protein
MNKRLPFQKARRAMKSISIKVGLTVCAVALCGIATDLGWAQSTADVLARLDQAARSFAGATASIRLITHTGIINEDETQIGDMTIKRPSLHEMSFLINFSGPAAQSIALRGPDPPDLLSQAQHGA